MGQRVLRTERRGLASPFRDRRPNDAPAGLRLMRLFIKMIRLVSAWVLVNGLLMTPVSFSGDGSAVALAAKGRG